MRVILIKLNDNDDVGDCDVDDELGGRWQLG